MNESPHDGMQIMPEGVFSAEMIDERVRIDTRYGTTAKLILS